MANRVRAVTAGSIVAVLLLGCGGDDTTSTPPASPQPTLTTISPSAPTTTTTTTTTTTSLVPSATTTTTTTTPQASEGTPPTAPRIPVDERIPEAFTVLFEESYVCDLGPVGESEIRASGEIAVEADLSQSGHAFAGEGDLAVTGFVRGGDICSGEGVGTHRVRLTGTIDAPDDGPLTLVLRERGTWNESWDGEIVCTAGMPPSGPWEWTPIFNRETLVFSPLEGGATWEKDDTIGMCRSTVTRTIQL